MKPEILDARQSAILAAAHRLVSEGGQESVSMAALGKLTGLSRPAIYQYFASKEHVLGELMINDMADLSNELDRLVEGIADPLEQIRIWLHYCLAHMSSAEHRVIREISIESLPEDQRGMLMAMHGFFMVSLHSPLFQLGVKDPSSLSGLVLGSVSAAAKRIDSGADYATEAGALEQFVIAGLEATLAS